MPDDKRTRKGQWKKGVSGNAGNSRKAGQISLANIVRKVCEEETTNADRRARVEEWVRRFVADLEATDTSLAERMRLFDMLIDRGYGKAVQAIQQETEVRVQFEDGDDPLGEPASVAAARHEVAAAVSAGEALSGHDWASGGKDDAGAPDGVSGGDEDPPA